MSETIINHPIVRTALERAWRDSQPGSSGGHEEGGFIVQDTRGNVRVMRWPSGGQDSITLPPYHGCRIGECDIIATFHTHPNTGPDYLQEPSETDRRAVRDDPDLKGALYHGEFVVSDHTIYLVMPNGQVREVGARADLFEARTPPEDD